MLKFFEKAGIKLAYSHKFDQALGVKHVRALLDGSLSHEEFAKEVTNNMQAFFYKAFDCFLYKPLPTILHV